MVRGGGEGVGEVVVQNGVIRVEADGGAEFGDSVVEAAGRIFEKRAEIAVRLGQVGIQANGGMEMRHGFVAVTGNSGEVAAEIDFGVNVIGGDVDSVLEEGAAVLPVGGLIPCKREKGDAGDCSRGGDGGFQLRV